MANKKKRSFVVAALYSSTFILAFLACAKAFPNVMAYISGTTSYVTLKHEDTTVEVPKVLRASACDEMKETCITDVILIQGDIDDDALSRIQQLTSSNVSAVCMTGSSGSLTLSLLMARTIISKQFNTCLARYYQIQSPNNRSLWIENRSCNSNCPWLLSAGRERTAIGTGLRIGIHNTGNIIGYKFPRIPINKEDKEVQQSIRAKHYEFYDFVKSIPNSTLYYLSNEEVQKFQLFTSYVNSYKSLNVMDIGNCKGGVISNFNCPPDIN